MGLVICPMHGKNGLITMGKDLYQKAINREKVDYIVEIIYDFGFDDKYGYFFSSDEAERFNIPYPGIILKFNMDSDDEPEDPFKIIEITGMCSKCFYEVYNDLVKDLRKKNNEYRELLLGFD